MTYDPTIQYFVENAIDRWGTPQEARKLLFPFGIEPLDQALSGINLIDGEMITVQGEEKQRKTTLVENFVIEGQLYVNRMLREGKEVVRPLVAVDMLESGMKPDKYFDTLVANLASRYLIKAGHTPDKTKACALCAVGKKEAGPCAELRLGHKFLRFNTRSQAQEEAIERALEEMSGWNVHIYGPGEDEGDTRNLEASVTGTRDHKSRWARLCDEHKKVIFVSDHLQQYNVPGADYEKQVAIVPAQSQIVAKYGAVVFSISQVSLTSARNAASGIEKLTAAGGRKAAQESNLILSTGYESGANEVAITIEDSRDAGAFSVWQNIEPVSGAFYGTPRRVTKLEFRPGMTQSNNGNGNNRK